MSLLKQIENLKTTDKENIEYSPPIKPKQNNILLWICGGFSILFSMSTLISFYTASISMYVFLVLGLFLFIVLVINETYKVSSLEAIGETYTKSKRFPLGTTIIGVITLLISLSSVYGLYTSLDKVLDVNQVQTLKLTNNSSKADSLSFILLYKTDSLSTVANPSIIATISELESRYKKLGYYETDKKEEIQSKLNIEKSKIEAYKKQIAEYISKEIKKEENLQRVEGAIGNKENKTGETILIALVVLAFIVETVIVVTAFSKGIGTATYDTDKSEYDSVYNKKIEQERKELESKPHVKKLMEYISLLSILYDFDTKEISRKVIEEVSALQGRKYTKSEIDSFRATLVQLKILQVNHTKTKLIVTFEEAKELLDNLFSKIK